MAKTNDYLEREVVYIYKDVHLRLIKICDLHVIKKSRFIKECVDYVLGDPKITKTVVTKCQSTKYGGNTHA